ncbi:serine protein kinase RIO [Nocardioides rotundus]|uniref:serine protein kinase RIO n=1 Tax=Nocardioides rotundus TaxID=1774216 RepID=UPI001CBD0B3A|nr:RIO1 family regulatory kinase/ATPase [Nocardioides rotundus]
MNTFEDLSSPDPIDSRFVFDWHAYDEPEDGDQRWSTWLSVEPLCRGPEPRPDWLVTSQAAIDTDLGILKTGKEADVFLLERALPPDDPANDGSPGTGVVMAAKRYRGEDERAFHRSAAYTEGRRVRKSRDARAMRKKTAHGRAVAAGQWAWAEWQALVRCHDAGLPVPYPVQIDGTEILMEWITDADGESAPRLAQTRPEPALLRDYFDQAVDVLATLAQQGMVHGDLSPYNILATGERLVVIDLPQVIDLVANPQGADFLLRDVTNVCRWFQARGLEVDEQEVYADLLAHAF